MERIRLIMSDIDGTIMPPGSKSVSARTVAAFHAAREAGIVIGPASGRGLRQIPAFLRATIVLPHLRCDERP